MRLIEGRLGDPEKTYPWYTILTDRVYVGDINYTAKALLRGFQVTHERKSDHNLRRFDVIIKGFTSALNLGYVIVMAELMLRDDSPGGIRFIKDPEDVMFVVDYTLLVV